MDEAAEELTRESINNVLLPSRQGNDSFVLLAGSVLGEKQGPEPAGGYQANRFAFWRRPYCRFRPGLCDPLDRSRALVNDARVLWIERDFKNRGAGGSVD